MLYLKRASVLFWGWLLGSGSGTGQFEYANSLPPADSTYVHSPVHMWEIAEFHTIIIAGYDPHRGYNKVAGRMFADHFLFFHTHGISPSKADFDRDMEDWLRDWSRLNNKVLYNRVFRFNEVRYLELRITQDLRYQLQNLD